MKLLLLVVALPCCAVAGKPKAIGMWVYNTSSTRDWLRCRIVEATGQTFQPTASEPLTWQG